MDYSDVNQRFYKRIKRINVNKDGSALVIFSDGSGGVFPNPESLNNTLEKEESEDGRK